MNVKPAIGFLTKDGDGPFTEKVTTILELMKGNPAFPSPTPTLATAETAFGAYKVAAAEAAQGGVQNTLARDVRRADLVALLRQLASYVSVAADGDMEKLMSSGFPLQKPVRTPIGPLTAPDAPRVSHGPVTGTLAAVGKPVYGLPAITGASRCNPRRTWMCARSRPPAPAPASAGLRQARSMSFRSMLSVPPASVIGATMAA